MKSDSLKYFAAANSRHGFYSLFGDVFSPEKYDTLYIIKGGSGTGKSTMMKKIGEEAERRGIDAEYVFCSSDPTSLDGVIIPARGAAIIDGTAPHMTDPKYPGAVERVIDLYGCLDTKALKEQRGEIIEKGKTAARYTATAYGFLRALGEIEEEKAALVLSCYDRKKAARTIERIVKTLTKGGEKRQLYTSAICSLGRVCFDAYRARAKEKICVADKFGAGYGFMADLCRTAKENGVGFIEFLSPLDPFKTEAVYFENDGTYVYICDAKDDGVSDKKINVMRFVEKEKLAHVRGRVRFCEKCADAVFEGAAGCFASARVCHAETEKIYGAAMDFSIVYKTREILIKEIFG